MLFFKRPTMIFHLTLAAGIMLLSAAMFAATVLSETTDQLVIFVQQGASTVDTAFRQKALPEIQRMADAMSVRVSLVDADKGVPQEIGITPLIVFQNYRGRSIYQGRYSTLERIRNFIRTSRFVPQMDAVLVQTDIPVWRDGRANIWAPVKIAPITGTSPAEYDHEAFVREAREAMEEGFSRFKTEGKISLGRSDRGFYMDLYPWVRRRRYALSVPCRLFAVSLQGAGLREEKRSPDRDMEGQEAALPGSGAYSGKCRGRPDHRYQQRGWVRSGQIIGHGRKLGGDRFSAAQSTEKAHGIPGGCRSDSPEVAACAACT